jgi:simple sugar transport system ATP-binding protein
MVHQHFINVPAMTVAENIALGGHGLFSGAKAAAAVRAIALRRAPARPRRARRVAGYGAQQRLRSSRPLLARES